MPDWNDLSSGSDLDNEFTLDQGENINVDEELGLSPVQETEEFIIINQVEDNVLIDRPNQNPEPNTNEEIANEAAQDRNKKRKIFPPRENVSKKRKSDPNTWKKKVAALARERGAEYVSYKNNIVPEKKIKDGVLCRENCRLKCSDRFSLKTELNF